MLRILLIHQNFPGQYRHLVSHLGTAPDVKVVGLGELQRVQANVVRPVPGVRFVGYRMPDGERARGDHLLRSTEDAVLRGKVVLGALLRLKQAGFVPEVIYAHPGWGETLFVRDVFPLARLLHFCEFYYSSVGQDFNFDPEYPDSIDDTLRVRVQNMHHLMALQESDVGISPTTWQRSRFPSIYWPRIEVVHDGIDTEVVRPDSTASVTLGSGVRISAGDEVITYVSRNLEPYRGFHTFMRSVPAILANRPHARILIVGGDDVSYGKRPADTTYRQKYLDELRGTDLSRVHFLGKLSYANYLRVLQISRVHVYLTYPFVLSWSLMEAMSAGCLVVGSDTAPVREVIRHGENGMLVDFFSPSLVAQNVIDACREPSTFDGLRAQARKDVIDKYDLRSICLPRQLAIIQDVKC